MSDVVKIVTIREAKTNLSRLIEEARARDEIIIVSGSEPLVRLVPVANVKEPRHPGVLKGKLRVGREFFESLPATELRAWE